MQLHPRAFAAAAAASMGICYVICAGFVVTWPQHALDLTASLFHLRSLELFEPYLQITPANFMSGLIQSMLYTYVYVWLLTAIYNIFVRRLVGRL